TEQTGTQATEYQAHDHQAQCATDGNDGQACDIAENAGDRHTPLPIARCKPPHQAALRAHRDDGEHEQCQAHGHRADVVAIDRPDGKDRFQRGLRESHQQRRQRQQSQPRQSTQQLPAALARCSGPWLSGSMNSTSVIATALSEADSSAGRMKLAAPSRSPASAPPMAGPSMKPMPIEAPTMPMVRARSRGVLTSEAYAIAAERLPAMKPARARAMNSVVSVCANARIR